MLESVLRAGLADLSYLHQRVHQKIDVAVKQLLKDAAHPDSHDPEAFNQAAQDKAQAPAARSRFTSSKDCSA